MFYKNARIFGSDFMFHNGAFEVTEDGKFGAVLTENVPADAIDLEGATVIPGLIEVHSHGNSGYDFSDGDYEGLKKMAEYYLSCGVTSFAPASMTLPYDVLEKAFATGKRLAEEKPAGCSRIRGIQMEGPYFSSPAPYCHKSATPRATSPGVMFASETPAARRNALTSLMYS